MGIIIGLVYCLLIFVENQFFYTNPLQFAGMKFLFYVFILVGYFYTGWLSKQQLGGYITFQECLKSVLLAITIAELIYLLFSIAYIKFIDPTFMDKLKAATQDYLISKNVPQENIDATISKFNDSGKLTIWAAIQSYGFAIIIDAIFGVIIALILKKPRIEFENTTQD